MSFVFAQFSMKLVVIFVTHTHINLSISQLIAFVVQRVFYKSVGELCYEKSGIKMLQITVVN